MGSQWYGTVLYGAHVAYGVLHHSMHGIKKKLASLCQLLPENFQKAISTRLFAHRFRDYHNTSYCSTYLYSLQLKNCRFRSPALLSSLKPSNYCTSRNSILLRGSSKLAARSSQLVHMPYCMQSVQPSRSSSGSSSCCGSSSCFISSHELVFFPSCLSRSEV